MDALIAAANSAGIRGLIDTYYDAGDVQGFALGVHGSFVPMLRAEFGRTFGINDILSADKTPAGWTDLCSAAGYSTTLSPIYVVIYVSIRASVFRANAKPPLMVAPNYAVFAESMAPFTARADRGKHRPIEGGTSVGSDSKPNHSGTLGGFLEDGGSQIYLLSCQHVLLNQHDTVVQQGSGDGGAAPVDAVGATAHVVPLVPPSGFTSSAPYNQVDAALAAVDPHISVSSAVRLLGAVKKTVPTSNLALGDKVVFVGKESDSQDSYVHHYIARVKIDIEKDGVQLW
jgi:hypothetical protein